MIRLPDLHPFQPAWRDCPLVHHFIDRVVDFSKGAISEPGFVEVLALLLFASFGMMFLGRILFGILV